MDFLTHPLFLAGVAGAISPFIHWFLRNLGVEFGPRVNFLVNVAISGLAFLPLVGLFTVGPVEPELFWASFGACVASAQATYKLVTKPVLEGPQEVA